MCEPVGFGDGWAGQCGQERKRKRGKDGSDGKCSSASITSESATGPKARENVSKGISLGCGESLSGAFVVVLSSQRIRNSGRVSKGESRKDMPREALER